MMANSRGLQEIFTSSLVKKAAGSPESVRAGAWATRGRDGGWTACRTTCAKEGPRSAGEGSPKVPTGMRVQGAFTGAAETEGPLVGLAAANGGSCTAGARGAPSSGPVADGPVGRAAASSAAAGEMRSGGEPGMPKNRGSRGGGVPS